jgi:hypothetical protein
VSPVAVDAVLLENMVPLKPTMRHEPTISASDRTQPIPDLSVAARAGIRSLDCGHDAEHDVAPLVRIVRESVVRESVVRESVVRRDDERRTRDRRLSDAPPPDSLLAALPDDHSLGEQSQGV